MAVLNTAAIPSIALSIVITPVISNLFRTHLPAYLHVLSLFSISLFIMLPDHLSQTLYAECILIFMLSAQHAQVSAPTNATYEVKLLLSSRVVSASAWSYAYIGQFLSYLLSAISTLCAMLVAVFQFCVLTFFPQVQDLSTPNGTQPPTTFSCLRDALFSKWCKVLHVCSLAKTWATRDIGTSQTSTSDADRNTNMRYTGLRSTAMHISPVKAVIAAFVDSFFSFLVAYMVTPRHPPFPGAMEETPVAENILSRGIAAGTGLATTYLSLRNLLDARMMTGVKATAYTLADACMGFLMDICVHVLVGIFVCSDVVEGIEWRLTVYKGIVLVVLERCLSRLAVKRWIVIGKVVVVSCLVYLCMKRYVEIVGKG